MDNKNDNDLKKNREKLLKRYEKVMKLFHMGEEDLVRFLFNFYDSVAFNRYYPDDYLEFDFNSEEELFKYVEFFNNNNIDKKTAKELFISIPSMLACKNPMEDIDIIYKDDDVEGLVIYDKDNYSHPYKRTDDMRSIMEDHSFVADLVKGNLDNKKNINRGFKIK